VADPAALRAEARRAPATGRDGKLVRHHAAHLRPPHRRLAHPLERPGNTQFFARQIGRARGDGIVQEGRHESGALLRWSFTGIKPNGFNWLGEVSADGGASWRRQVEVLARRA
jgi:hypothetical protein